MSFSLLSTWREQNFLQRNSTHHVAIIWSIPWTYTWKPLGYNINTVFQTQHTKHWQLPVCPVVQIPEYIAEQYQWHDASATNWNPRHSKINLDKEAISVQRLSTSTTNYAIDLFNFSKYNLFTKWRHFQKWFHATCTKNSSPWGKCRYSTQHLLCTTYIFAKCKFQNRFPYNISTISIVTWILPKGYWTNTPQSTGFINKVESSSTWITWCNYKLK